MAAEGSPQAKSPGHRKVLGACVFLVAITWLVFGQTLRYGFVNYDDSEYVYANPTIASGVSVHGLIHTFSSKHAGNWHPLTSMSHMLDCQLWGLHAGGHHLTNIVLHTIAVILLFLVMRQMTGAIWKSAFVAAVFAIHPLHVESVAWISERKDVLSAVFFMLTLGAYVRYVRSPSVGRYLMMSSLFALGLMSKPMLVTVPFVLLLLDYWPLKRFAEEPSTRRLVLEKIPLLALSVASGLATLWAQQSGVAAVEELPLISRITNGLVTYLIYLRQMIWPAQLAVFYPHPGDKLPIWEIALATVVLILASTGAIALRRKHPYLITGWFWYLAMLMPVIGLIQVGFQAHADRYTYLPQIGLYLLTTWAATDASAWWPHRRRILGATAAMVIVASAWCAQIQASYWRDSDSLWAHTLAVTSENPIAQNNLAAVLKEKGRTDEAIGHLEKALELNPNDANVYYNLGNAFLQKRQFDEAITDYKKGLAIQPRYADAHYNLGIALAQKGDVDAAIAQFQKAVEDKPDYAVAYYALGNAFLQKGQFDEAIARYQQALKSRPTYPEVENNIGLALLQKGRPSEAIAHWQNALAIRSDSVDSLNNLAWVLATFPESWIRNRKQALVLAERANQLSGDNNPAVLRTLAAAYAENGRFTEARVTAERGLQLANAQENHALANIFEGDLARYRRNAPVRTATQPGSASSP